MDKWWEDGCASCWALDQTADREAAKIRSHPCLHCRMKLSEHEMRHPHKRVSVTRKKTNGQLYPSPPRPCDGYTPLRPPTNHELENIRKELEKMLNHE